MIVRYITASLLLGVATLMLGAGAVHRGYRAESPSAPVLGDALECELPPEFGTIFEGISDVPPLAAADDEAKPAPEAICPAGMVHVSGEYCTEIKHECVEWLDDRRLPFARCARYAKPSKCVGRRVPMDFCVDRYEYAKPGSDVPANYMSFDLGQKLCRSLGKRLCTESEWNFACEGEELKPYPYGWEREPKCNQDRGDLLEVRPADGKPRQMLKDLREPNRDDSDCVSPFGVVNMVGNLDEPVLREAARFSPPYRNALKGGWWMAGRNRCRPATIAHDDFYRDVQIGVRCCADVPGDSAPTG